MSRRRAYLAGAAAVGIFLLVQLGALALVDPFKAAGYQTVENPSDPTNSLVYLLAILIATAVMLAAFRFGVERLVKVFVVASAGLVTLYVFSVLVPPVLTVTVGGSALNVLAVGAAALLAVALFVYPEWYVIDSTGVVMGAGAAALFGISFGLLPAILLLAVLAVYDAISVYGTEHMLTLASGVMDLKIPVVLVVPLSLSYSYLDAEVPEAAETADEGESDPTADEGESGPFDREAFFIGLGDAVMPTVLVASAAFFAPGAVPDLGVPGLALTLPALTAMIGTLLGLVALLWLVMKGRAHAGLPLLNGGAIGGYLLGALVSGVSLAQAIGLASYL
ncbi:MAG: presenilin family intramembrane aspartyl protease PSH [Haloarculaceae archaeon]